MSSTSQVLKGRLLDSDCSVAVSEFYLYKLSPRAGSRVERTGLKNRSTPFPGRMS